MVGHHTYDQEVATCEFYYSSGHDCIMTLGKRFTAMCPSPSGIIWYCQMLGCKQATYSCTRTHARTHTHTHKRFNNALSGTTHGGWYQKKHSPTHTHADHQTSFTNFLHLLRSTASSLFYLHAQGSFSTTSLQLLFGLPQCVPIRKRLK